MSQKTSHLPSTPKGKKALQAFTPLALSLAAASSANAAIVYAPLDLTFNADDDDDTTFDVNLFGDAVSDLGVRFDNYDASAAKLDLTGINPNNQFKFFLTDTQSRLKFAIRFTEGAQIEANWSNQEATLGLIESGAPYSANDTWLPVAGASRTGYIGFALQDGPDADDPIYRGWMKVSVRAGSTNSPPVRLTLHAWAYNDEAGEGINAGQGVPVPESSTTAGALGLLALGAAYRLRKRQG